MATTTHSGKPATAKTPTAGRPAGRIDSNVIQHSLKPTSPSPRPSIKPDPGPKTK